MDTGRTCTPKSGGFSETQCDALISYTKQAHRTVVGLMISNVVNIETSESKGKRISLRKSQHDDIVTLNYCPFCGNPVRDLSKD